MTQEQDCEDLELRLEGIRADMTALAERLQSLHNHKESVAYLTLTATAVLFAQLESGDWTGCGALLVGVAMVFSHAFMRQELRERRRVAFMIAAADATRKRIAFEPGKISSEDIAMEPPPDIYEPQPFGFQQFLLFIVPTRYVDFSQLREMAWTRLTRIALEEQVELIRGMKRDGLPSWASLTIVLTGLVMAFEKSGVIDFS